jgi:hypothetical protein
MAVGEKRTMVARAGAALGFLCGVIGLLAGLTQHSWKLAPLGWFAGGTLLTLLALYALVDGAIAFQKTQPPK